jgi:Fic family protein
MAVSGVCWCRCIWSATACWSSPRCTCPTFFERNRASYYDALMRVRTGNDLIHWVRFFLQGVAETATKGRNVFQQILALRTEAEQKILTLGKRAPNARQALNLLYRKPMLSAADLEHGLGITHPTANALLRDFIRLGLLREITGASRHRLYVFETYLDLFIR